MNMNRLFLLIGFLFNLGAVGCSSNVQSEKYENEQGLDYYLLDDGTYGVGIGNACFLSSIVIPSSYRGRAVSGVVPSGFENSSVVTVTISEGVKSIGYCAFRNCGALKTISVPDSIINIEQGAFEKCTALVFNNDGNGGYYLGNDANPYVCLMSYSSRAQSFLINANCKAVCEKAFHGCTSLTSISIPDGVAFIGFYAFGGCSSLETIVLPDSLIAFGRSVFSGCNSLISINIPNQVTSISESLFSSCGKLQSISLPKGLISIESSAFDWCTALPSIVIPDSVAFVGRYAFQYCYSLTIYCEAEHQPRSWDSDWNTSRCPVVWGYTG